MTSMHMVLYFDLKDTIGTEANMIYSDLISVHADLMRELQTEVSGISQMFCC